MIRTPILIVSDSPNGPTGLGMVSREISTRIQYHLSDVVDVAMAGLKDDGSNKQPFPVYPFSEMKDFLIPELPWIWKRFAGERKGIIMTVWNIGWLGKFTHPELIEPCEFRDFMMSGRFKHWAYVPVDSENPVGCLSGDEERILKRIDRVLAYTKYGADVIDRTLGHPEGTTEHIPHGTDAEIFHPRDRKEARKTLLSRIGQGVSAAISDKVTIIGIFATNTSRKDWPLALNVCGRLVNKGYNIGVLIHTDVMKKDWNLKELCLINGLKGRVFESVHRPGVVMSHEDVAWLYSACDCVLCPGRGEGWGSPSSESLACGVPNVTGNYAGSTDFTPRHFVVDPIAYQVESFWNNKRPVHDPDRWVDRVENLLEEKWEPRWNLLGSEWMWDQVWPRWEKWIREGIKCVSWS